MQRTSFVTIVVLLLVLLASIIGTFVSQIKQFNKMDAQLTTNGTKLNALTVRVTTLENSKGNGGTTGSVTPISLVSRSSLLSAAIDFFGDSITEGFRVSPTQRWSALVCNSLSKTENNFGVGGAQWADSAVPIYNSHQPGNSAFLAYGVNDIARGQRFFDQMKRCIYSAVMYCCLPDANKVNARAATMSPANAWENTGAYNTVGVMTSVATGNQFPNSPTIQATVKGRYIGFSSTVVNTATIRDNWSMNVSVDGNVVGGAGAAQVFFNIQNPSALGSSFMPYLYFYDTGDTTSNNTHTIQLTPLVNGNYNDRAFCDYFFGFDAKQSGCNSVFLMQPTNFDFSWYDINQAIMADDGAAMAAYKTMLRDVAFDFSNRYGLPVTTITDAMNYDMGYTSFDLVHPLSGGQKQIADRVLQVLAQNVTAT